jgi:DNA repair protein RadC
VREIQVRYLPSDVPLDDCKPYRNSRDIFEGFRDLIQEPVEVFRVLLLDSKNRPLHIETVSRGSLSTSIVHPREALWSAVYHRAAAFICVHNHPSGDPAPSKEDRECTQRLFRASKILGIRMLDHIVIGQTDYFSFADAGLLTEGG